LSTSSGFGRETALLFAEQGADVIAVDINLEAAERSAELVRLLGAQVWARQVDVGSVDQMEALAAWVATEFGAPDVVVNNAGIGVAGSFFDTSMSDWEKVLRVNLWGVIYGSRLFGQQMIAAGKRGHIVNVASMGGFTPSKFMSAYNTSKAAVMMLSDCIRAELADKKINVSTICPGLSITNITQTTRFVGVSAEEQAKRQQKATKLYQRRNLKPQVIAQAILDAVEHNRAEVPVGAEAHGSRLISRFFPALSRRLARLNVVP
jgi:NAD(P)-dependent dehydrogenase (short-subunit alcohol dehydrogenase family)